MIWISSLMNISGRLCRPAFARPLRRTVHATCLKGTQQQLQTSTMSSGHKAGAQPPQISADAGPHQQQQQQQRTRATQGQLVEAAAFPSPVPLIDIGVNLVDKSFQGDLPAVLSRARAANVRTAIVTGTCVRTSEAAARLVDNQAANYPLFFTAGVHPHNAKQCDVTTLDRLRRLLAHPRCVAVGEAGLDFNRNFSPPDVQEVWFDAQVALAKELRRPLFLHCRDAADRFIHILSRHMPLPAPAVVHCFTGGREELQRLLDLGIYIGITGWIADDRPERGGAELAALLPLVPRDRLMIETDAPYLVPRSIKPSKARPGRNEPALLPHVLRTAADALGVSPEELGTSTTAVACKVFQIPDSVLQDSA